MLMHFVSLKIEISETFSIILIKRAHVITRSYNQKTGSAVVECSTRDLRASGLSLTKSLHCVLEQDKLILA